MITMEDLAKQEMENNRRFNEFNRNIAKEIWGNR